MGNYLRLKLLFLEAAQETVEVIKWFNNHSQALDMLHRDQLKRYGHALALIVAVIVRG